MTHALEQFVLIGLQGINHALRGASFAERTLEGIVNKANTLTGFDLVFGKPIPDKTGRELLKEAWKNSLFKRPNDFLSRYGISTVDGLSFGEIAEQCMKEREEIRDLKVPWNRASTPEVAFKALVAILHQTSKEKISRLSEVSESIKPVLTYLNERGGDFVMASPQTVRAVCYCSVDYMIAFFLQCSRSGGNYHHKEAACDGLLHWLEKGIVPTDREREVSAERAKTLLSDHLDVKREVVRKKEKTYYGKFKECNWENPAEVHKTLEGTEEFKSLSKELQELLKQAVDAPVDEGWQAVAYIDHAFNKDFTYVVSMKGKP